MLPDSRGGGLAGLKDTRAKLLVVAPKIGIITLAACVGLGRVDSQVMPIFWGVGAKKTTAIQGEEELAPLLPQISIYTKETIVPQGIPNSAESACWKTGR